VQRARKRFGQHFLRDPGAIGDFVHAVAPAPGDCLVEIGPGRGAITDPLSRLAGKLHAIEFDRDLVHTLRARYARTPSVTIHQADALDFDYASLGSDLRIVGNLPYNISTPLLFRLIEYRQQIRDMHFMLQKEVVDRMAAMPGSKAYGRLTIMLGCHMGVVPLFDVPPSAFEPPPKVVSAVVRLAPLPPDRYRIDDPALLSRIVTQGFSQRRKTVRNALRAWAGETELRAAGIDPGARAEQIPIETWIGLANALTRESRHQ
jgi:16S rRNA (adenine1518-N6/adenine1519-N6)-dimethyltransferase